MPEPDDGSIADSDNLLRRIHPEQLRWDEQAGAWRPTTAAFRDPEMSVDSEEMLASDGKTVEWSLEHRPTFSLARLPAKSARELDQTIVAVPLSTDPGRNGEPNPYHCEVHGNKTGSIRNKLKEASTLAIINPPEEQA